MRFFRKKLYLCELKTNRSRMDSIRKMHFEGERPLFERHHLRLEQVTIGDGESAIKECSDIVAEDCRFGVSTRFGMSTASK